MRGRTLARASLTHARPRRADHIFNGVTPQPGSIILLRRKWWEGRACRKDQSRGRLEDGVQVSSDLHGGV